MPKGPQGQKRPADVIGGAVKIAKIATGEIEEDTENDEGKNPKSVEAGRKGGIKGGAARAKKLNPEQRKKIAQNAARTRWKAGAEN